METYLERRRALVASAAPGLAAARELASMTDEAVSALAEAASARLGRVWAVVALGGYGAGRLLPGSDLDILLLAEDGGGAIRDAARQLLCPLWDAGMDVGHQVRTRKEHLLACREDLETLTASLTGRVIAGDAAYAGAVLGAVAADAGRRRRRLLAALAERPRPGSPYLLEPDLKEGRGGQRDLDEIGWTAAVVLGEPAAGPEAAMAAKLAGTEDGRALSDAAELLAAARWRLHVLGAGAAMTAEAAYGMGGLAVRVQRTLPATDDALVRVRAAAAGAAGGAPRARGGRGPGGATARGRAGAGGSGPLGAGSGILSDPGALLAAVRAGQAAEIERAAWSGGLDPILPGLGALMTLRRPALSHTLTVGAHGIAAACSVDALAREEPSLARSAEDAGDLRPVEVAALVHDAGKLEPGPGHAERGAAGAEDAARLCGLSAEDARLTSLLVREHLLLPEAALRTDPDDRRALDGLAERIGDRRTLGALHLLSAADATATGAAWDSWHAALLGRLVGALHERMSDPAGDAGRPVPSPGRVTAADAALVAAVPRMGHGAPPVLAVGPGPVPGSWVLTLAAIDRPRLFADLSGVLALAGLDVLSASACRREGVALDRFTVRSATLAPAGPETWTKVERLLGAVARERLCLATRLAERRSHYRAASPGVPPGVRFDRREGACMLMEVEAADRVGLLYDIAAALSECDLDIDWANAVSRDGVARDVFGLRASGGAAPTPGVLGHAAMRVRERLGRE